MNFVLTTYAQSWLGSNPGVVPLLSEYRIGSAYNYTPDPTDTDLHGDLEHSGTPSVGTLLPSGEFQYSLYLDRTVGDFQWGEVGLYHNGSLFALGALSSLQFKRKATGAVDGNYMSILASFNPNGTYGILEVANSSNELNIQERGSVDLLPPAQSSYPNTFLVPHPTQPERGLIATASGSVWNISGYDQHAYAGSLDFASSNAVRLSGAPILPLENAQWVIQFFDGAAAGLVRSGTYDPDTHQIVLSSPLQWSPSVGDNVLISVLTVPSLLPELPTILDELDPALTGADLNQLMNLTTFFGPLLKLTGADPMEGDLLMGGHQVKGLAAPTLATDASTKGYVDSAVTAATANLVDATAVSAAIDAATADFLTQVEVVTQINTIVGDTLALELVDYARTADVAADILAAIAPLATLSYVNDQISSISGDWATVTYVNTQIGIATDGLASTTDLSDALVGLASVAFVESELQNTLLRDGTRIMAGDLDLGEHRIIELGEPTGSNHAATKNYVDTGLAQMVPLDGSVALSGDLNAGGNSVTNLGAPTAALDAATKGYVDTEISELGAAVIRRDGTAAMQASLDMGTNRIRNVAAPIDSADAARKSYVDTAISTLEDNVLLRDGSQPLTGDLDADSHDITGLPTHATSALDLTVAASLQSVQNFVDAGISAFSSTVLLRNGTNAATGNLPMGNNRITGMAAPVLGADAATKAYVDSAISDLTPGTILRTDGSVPLTEDLEAGNNYIVGLPLAPLMTGPTQDPTQATSLAVVESMLDSALATVIHADGTVPFTAAANLGTNRIINVANPTAAQDAATKNYVDTAVSAAGSVLTDGSRPMTGTLNTAGNRITGLPATQTDVSDAVSYAGLSTVLAADLASYLRRDGTAAMTAAFNFGGFKGVGLATPTADTDAATKKYVDDTVMGLDSTVFVLRDGSRAMTGSFNFGGFAGTGLTAYDPIPANHTWSGTWPNAMPTDWPVDMTRPASIGHLTMSWTSTRAMIAGYVDGTTAFPGAPNMGGNKVVNLGTPTANTDAATKQYVDSAVASGGGAYVPLNGSVALTGNLNAGNFRLTNVAAPTVASDAANRTYVDGVGALMVRRDGSTAMTAALNFGGFKGLSLATPTAATDAANKSYVDSAVSTGQSGVVMRNGSQAMTGALSFGGFRLTNLGDPTASTDAVNRAYVDTNTESLVPRDGSRAMTGAFNAGGFRVSGVAEPTLSTDAATKNYVDSTALSGVVRTDGTVPMVANLDVGGNRVTNVTDPTDPQDAATLNFVDAAILNLSTSLPGLYVSTSGASVMEGDLDLGTNKIVNVVNPTAAQDAATKNYVDGQTALLGSSVVKLDGTNAMTADLNAGGFKVTNVAAPTVNTDGANKQYVDTQVGTRAPSANPSFTGSINFNGSERALNVTLTDGNIDCSLANYFDITVSAPTTFAFTNVPAGAYLMLLLVDHQGGTLTFPASVSWPGGVAPTLNTGRVHLFNLFTNDGGVKWRASLSSNHFA